jgi:hypothetical protein
VLAESLGGAAAPVVEREFPAFIRACGECCNDKYCKGTPHPHFSLRKT